MTAVRITRIASWVEHLPLTRPYTIAFRRIEAVDIVCLRIETDTGLAGLGAASPEPFVTGETPEVCRAALAPRALEWLTGEDVRSITRFAPLRAARLAAAPAARAAVDMAIHDLHAQFLELPLVDVLGRVHDALPTSITIGIKSVDATLAEAREYVARGFEILKVKGGHDLESDILRVARLREEFGSRIAIRVDPNQGYSLADVVAFMDRTAALDIEFLEQPVKAADTGTLRALPENLRLRIAADESLLSERDALQLLIPSPACGIFNIKLMKCGGIFPALRIAALAETAGVALMWGCMDESRVSVAAALHTALACPATRYLDLDGHLDLARDVVEGGAAIAAGGVMSCADGCGLGVRAVP